MKTKVNFYDIMNNPDYYERIENGEGKDFFVWMKDIFLKAK